MRARFQGQVLEREREKERHAGEEIEQGVLTAW